MSKDLIPLEIVKRWKAQIHWNKDFGWDKEITIVEKELTDAEKNKKALEIIEEKGLHYLEVSMIKSNLSYEDYLTEMNITIGVRPMIDSKIKTKEEYELLKELLK